MSNLMKMKRLVDGDDHFNWRVEAACWANNVEFSKEVVKHVAADADVLAAANMDEHGTIDSSPVTDEMIENVVASLNN